MPPTILCLDDEEAVRRMMRDSLEPHGYRVLTATKVSEALQVTRENKIDLIIADVFLPDTDGISFLDLLAAEFPTRKIPVIMASGCGAADSRNRAVQRGAVAYLQKPFQVQQLLKIMSWAAPVPEPADRPTTLDPH